ncbi:MAG: DinB family protein [Gemmatimonadota bacterium]|nr:DinB family protein [Gemmatimonadota bacterium]
MTGTKRAGFAGLAIAALLLTGAMDATAQSADGMKGYLIDAFERAKAWDISLAEAIPDSAMDWAPNADVRGFAAQIVHTANNGFIAMPLFGEDAPAFGDEAELVADRAALIAAVTNAYDFLIGKLETMDGTSLGDEVDFFGRTMTRGRVALFALEHAMWTRGQLVPYLHAHGVAVPAQRLF